MLAAAESLLNSSPDRDISTRAVCDAVGAGAPTLYRLFGDKRGLLSAVVDHGFDRYLATKRAARPSADPVADLTAGWDSHIAFALAHPVVYQLMFSPALTDVPRAADEALEILCDVLRRCAEAGRLRVPPREAAQAVMAATVGVALSLVTQPRSYRDPGLSARVRDAVFAAVLTPANPRTRRSASAVAQQLSALLQAEPPAALSEAETALLHEWLGRIGDQRRARSQPKVKE